MGKRALGIDIGAGSVKLVELEKTVEGIQLIRAKFFDLTQYADQEKRDTLIREGIEGLLRTEKIKSGRLALSLSGQSVFIRFLKLPKIQQGKIDKIIKYEAQQQIPFPLDKISWDHQIFRSGAGPEEDVLFVAAKKEIVETTLSHVARTNLDIEFVDVSPLALLNAITYNEPLGKGLILDIGAKATNLIVISDKGFWVRSILIAGDEMTHAIASKLNIPFDKAEELKRKEGMVVASDSLVPSNITPAGKDLVNALNPVVSDLISSIVQSMEFYRTKHAHDTAFNEIILSGGGSKLKGIEDFLAKGLGMQIRRANLGQKIKCPSNLRVDIDFQTRFGSSIGLALRLLQRCPTNIDLLPVERKEERDFKKEKFWIISAGLLIAVIPLTIGYNIWFQTSTLRKEVAFLDSLLSDYENINKEIAKLKEDIKNSEARLEPFENLAIKKSLSLEAILGIRKLLPEETWLTSVSKEKDFFSLEGRTASSLLTINDFKNRLASSPLFDSVEIIYASLPRQTEEGAGQFRDFSIKFRFKGTGAAAAAPKGEKDETKGNK
ncbi:MAG: type IV pilus assembly protein PilM [Candidatus Omnitrophica bacterium]|nr:type IV pilus assembly protein PilM [Candidatus Omnitrophota bacterium]